MVKSIIAEAEYRSGFFYKLDKKVTTLYFGGGTPSLLSIEEVRYLIDSLSNIFAIDVSDKTFEFTVEANPDDLSLDYLRALRGVGVNRLSLGFQSFVDEHLVWMNRRHNSKQAKEVFSDARKAGFDNVSIDLIFGYSLLTINQWEDEIREIIKLKPEHISAYQMSIEPNSKLGREYEKGKYIPISDESSFREYELLREMLLNAGYLHYEISNFALPQKESKHNSSYWNGTPYLGLGPGAHSYDGKRRFWNLPNIKKYNNFFYKTDNKESDEPVEDEILTASDIFNEKIMLSLRKTEGLDLHDFEVTFPQVQVKELKSKIIKLIDKGELLVDGVKIKIPPEKLFVSDGIIRELFI